MKREWGREDQADHAVERILEAAGKAFVELGVPGTGMGEIAEFAGCSRGTLYRYFKNRHELHVAFVRRTAQEIQRRVHEAVQAVDDPRERLVEYVLRAVQEVRENPAAAAWFSDGASGMATRMARSAEVAGALTSAFAAELPSASHDDSERELRHQWIVRVIVSLLADPGGSDGRERMLIERFVVPVVMDPERN